MQRRTVADANLYRRQKYACADAYDQRRQTEARAEVADAADARALKMRAEAEALKENQEALLAQRVVDQLPTP